MKKFTQKVARWVCVSTLATAILSTSTVYAAGFQISETSVSALGRSFAGYGVAGDSISEMFANPASLGLRYDTEFEIGIHAIAPSADFESRGSTQTLRSAAGALTIPSRGTNTDGGDDALVPNFYFAHPLTDKLRFGLGVTAPFGLVTDYGSNSIVRYAAIKSDLKTIDVNPSLAYTIGDHTFGAGISLVDVEAELTRALFTGPGSPDGLVTLKGDDTAFAYNLGYVGENEVGRFGVGFRSRTSLDVEGTINIEPLGITGGATSKVSLPKTVYLSGLLKKSPKLDLLGSIRWTDWDAFEELRFSFDNGLPDSVTPENWDASITTSVGFNYRASDVWTYRGGIAYDTTPVQDEFRTARIPDADRFWVSFGGSYQASERMRVDFGFVHIFADNVPLTESTNLVATAPGAATDNLNGQYTETDANILSVAVSFKVGGKK